MMMSHFVATVALLLLLPLSTVAAVSTEQELGVGAVSLFRGSAAWLYPDEELGIDPPGQWSLQIADYNSLAQGVNQISTAFVYGGKFVVLEVCVFRTWFNDQLWRVCAQGC